MSWPMVKLGDVCQITMGQAPSGSFYNEKGQGYALIAGAGDFGQVNPIPKKYTTKASKLSKSGDIILCIRATIGDLNWSDKEYCLGRGVAGLRGKERLDQGFLWHCLNYNRSVLSSKGTGSTFKQISRNHIEELVIPLPPVEEQKRIAAILDKADGIRQKREQALKLADDFLRATFLEMFGDPVENPKRWDVASLLEYGSFKNGMNFTKGESGSVLKCLGVGNFKSLATITCMDNIGEIELNTLPSDDYLLKDGDIVFVRSNGNKALVGRCLTIYPNKEKVTFSGFCIRYRIEKSAITAEYLNFLFRTPSMKRQMLSGGQGANIQNISQGTLSALRIPVPPLEKQQTFSKVVSFHSELMKKLNINIIETNDMFGSISQKHFN